MSLTSDLTALLLAAATGTLENAEVTWSDDSAVVVVMAHPYYTVTNKTGDFELHLPAGKHKIMVQHQTLNKLDKKGEEVEIKDGETVKHAGYLDGMEISRDDAEAMIMAARVHAGWIEAAPAKDDSEAEGGEG